MTYFQENLRDQNKIPRGDSYPIYYNAQLKLGLGYNLGKDLSKDREDDQLVKYKDIESYLQLYIPNDYEK